jgi:hypothetical protein
LVFPTTKTNKLEVLLVDDFLCNKLGYFGGRHTEEITENILIVFSKQWPVAIDTGWGC